MSSSWKLESSQTIDAPGSMLSATSVRATPTLPATSTRRPAARRIAPRSAVVARPDRPEELGRRRLAVRPRDADERVAGEKPVAELDLAPDGDAPCARGGHEGRLARHTRALYHELDTLQQRLLLVPESHFDACRGKPPGVGGRGAVGRDDLHPAPRESERRGPPRAREPEYEGTPRQPVVHGG